MNNPETTIMHLQLEHERLIKESVEEARIRRALAQEPARTERPAADGMLIRARDGAEVVRRGFRRWLALPWDERTPRDAVAAASKP
jgi:hypothetical protein